MILFEAEDSGNECNPELSAMLSVPKCFEEFSKWENCPCIFKKHYGCFVSC